MIGNPAYTRIEPGLVRIGNAWSERVWTTLIGHTAGILHPAAGETLDRDLPEDAGLGPEADFGPCEWSETCDPFAATLVCQRAAPRFWLEIETAALHDRPGLRRRVRLRPRDPDWTLPPHALRIDAIEGASAWCAAPLPAPGIPDGLDAGRAALLVNGGRGWLVAAAPGAACHIAGPRRIEILTAGEDNESDPGAPFESYLMPFNGAPAESLLDAFPALLQGFRLRERHLKRRQKAADEESGHDPGERP